MCFYLLIVRSLKIPIQEICIINRISNESVIFEGSKDLLDMFIKSFVLNVGMKYEDLETFFSKYEN